MEYSTQISLLNWFVGHIGLCISAPLFPTLALFCPAMWRSTRNTVHRRFYATPLLKSYSPIKTPTSLFWNSRVPLIAKAFSGCVAAALSLTHIHPDVLITVGPPVLGAGYYLYRRLWQHRFAELLELVLRLRGGLLQCIKVPRYDETDVELARKDIDSELAYFLSVVLPAVESRVVDSLVEFSLRENLSPSLARLIDENGQIKLNMALLPETLVTLKAEDPSTELDAVVFLKFISFSVPFYDSKDPASRDRLGVLEVSMLEHPVENKAGEKDNDSDYYDIGINIWPHTSFSRAVAVG